MTDETIENSIRTWSAAMRAKLYANIDKGGWHYETEEYFIKRLHQEVKELLEADPADSLTEAADVANIAFMLSDVRRNRLTDPNACEDCGGTMVCFECYGHVCSNGDCFCEV